MDKWTELLRTFSPGRISVKWVAYDSIFWLPQISCSIPNFIASITPNTYESFVKKAVGQNNPMTLCMPCPLCPATSSILASMNVESWIIIDLELSISTVTARIVDAGYTVCRSQKTPSYHILNYSQEWPASSSSESLWCLHTFYYRAVFSYSTEDWTCTTAWWQRKRICLKRAHNITF